jgi:polysaccharide biosynthesis/export protein
MAGVYRFFPGRGWLGFVLAMLVLIPAWTLSSSAQQTPAPAPTKSSAPESGTATPSDIGNPPSGNPDSHSAVELGPGDLVEVNVYNVPELTTKLRISGAGDLYLPLIDYVHVGGLTVDEAQSLIEKRLSDGGFVKDPHVTLFVDEYTSDGVSLLGEVAKPGVYPILGDEHLFDLISEAGGLSDKAGNSVTITHRAEPEKPVTVPLAHNVSEVPQSNIRVLPGDTVVVRRADIVYVVGDVQHPTGILIDRGSISVLQAIALAGGTTKTSKMNGCKIIHKDSGGMMTESKVELKKILEAKATDIPMKPNDILFVPTSSFKSAFRDNAAIAMQATSLGLVASAY